MDLHGRSLLKETDLTAEEFLYLVDLAGTCAPRNASASGSTGSRAGTSR